MSTTTKVYGPGSGNSYFADIYATTFRTVNEKAASERLKKSAEWSLTYDEARTVRAHMQTEARAETEHEFRALSSSANSAGVFVTPQYLVEEGSIWNSYPPAVTGQCTSVPDPGWGLQLKIPLLTAITSTAEQTTVGENTGIDDTSPSGQYESGALVTLAGEVPVSVQAFDRSGPEPYTLDRILTIALRDALAAEVDSYILSVMQSAGGSTAGASSFSAANFLQDVANAQQNIMTGAGVRLPATHCFTTPTLAQWLLSASDENGRPILTPKMANAPTAVKLTPSGGAAPGYEGVTLLGSHFFSDGNLADVANTNPVQAPLVFANCAEVFVQQSEPCVRIVPYGSTAGTLTVLVQLWSFLGVVVRHSNAVNTLSGSAYLANPSFT